MIKDKRLLLDYILTIVCLLGGFLTGYWFPLVGVLSYIYFSRK